MNKIIIFTSVFLISCLSLLSQENYKNPKQRFKLDIHSNWNIVELKDKCKIYHKNNKNTFFEILWDKGSSKPLVKRKINKSKKRKSSYKKKTVFKSTKNTRTYKTDSKFVINSSLTINNKVFRIYCNLLDINKQTKDEIEKMVDSISEI